MNPQSELYHRTYLPDGSYGPLCERSCHTTPAPGAFNRPPMVDFSKIPGAKPALPLITPPQQVFHKPATYRPGQGRFSAYRFAGDGLYQTHIVEHVDQNFRSHATPFEIKNSTLLYKLNFKPVVEDLVVVGHVGTVSQYQIFKPFNHPAGGVHTLLEEGAPLYVSDENPDSEFWTTLGSPYVSEKVVTAVDGEVLVSLGTHDRQALEESDFWLLDAIFVAKGIASLGVAIGSKLVKSLTRRAVSRSARFAFMGASRQIAKEAADQLKRRPIVRGVYESRSGMTEKHFKVFQEGAAKTQHIAVVRNTNPAGVKLIEAGCPAKPLQFKFHTSPRTGVVMAETANDVRIAHRNGYYVVDPDGVARRTVIRDGKAATEELRLENPFWSVEKGQVIDGASRKPVVGDYDLMGVIDPRNTGQNIALHNRNGVRPSDISSPIIEEFKTLVNGRMDRPRVMHGAQDQFADFRGGATVFYPDGKVTYLADEAAVKAFYQSIGRETIKGSYPRPSGSASVVDELAARRAGR